MDSILDFNYFASLVEMCHTVYFLKCKLLQIQMFSNYSSYSFFVLLSFQNISPLEEMQMAGRACILSCTKTNGTQTALLRTEKIGLGVRFKLNLIKNSGATAHLTVSTYFTAMREYTLAQQQK